MVTSSLNPLLIQVEIISEELRVSAIKAIVLGFNIFSTEEQTLDTVSSVSVSLGIPLIPSVPKNFFNERLSFSELLGSSSFLKSVFFSLNFSRVSCE